VLLKAERQRLAYVRKLVRNVMFFFCFCFCKYGGRSTQLSTVTLPMKLVIPKLYIVVQVFNVYLFCPRLQATVSGSTPGTMVEVTASETRGDTSHTNTNRADHHHRHQRRRQHKILIHTPNICRGFFFPRKLPDVCKTRSSIAQ
jgi:hypothetical protein